MMNNQPIEIIKKPWGHEQILAKTDHYVMKLLYINSGHRLSLQYHNFKEETIYVSEGELLVWTDGSVNNFTIYPTGTSYHVKPQQVHRFGAGDSDVILIEASTPELEDVIRLADDYKRLIQSEKEIIKTLG